jgi:signal transduction histidine kinase/DNA-binding response OmpR family regulator
MVWRVDHTPIALGSVAFAHTPPAAQAPPAYALPRNRPLAPLTHPVLLRLVLRVLPSRFSAPRLRAALLAPLVLLALSLSCSLAPTMRAAAADFDPERGLPLLQRFLPEAYQGHYQINDLTVAPDGRLYGTTQHAVVRYDGTRWERLEFPGLWAWRLVATADGRVYVSGDDDLGYFADDATGRAVYHSLVSKIPAAALPLGNVRGAKAAGNAVAFAAEKGWLVWQDGAFNFTPSPTAGRTLVHSANNTLYASIAGSGLLRWDGRAWQPFAATTSLAHATVSGLATLPGNRLLALAAPADLVALSADGTTAEKWSGPGATALLALRPLGLLTLPDGRVAAFTRSSGLALVTSDGAALTRYDKTHGIPSNTTYGLAVDHEGGLWVGGTNGVARLDLVTPATIFDERNAPGPGSMRSFTRQDGTFYAGVVEGVHRLVPADPITGAPAHFERIPGTTTTVNDLAPHPAGLLVATTNTLHLYRPETGFRTLLQRNDDFSVVWTTPTDPARIYLGADKALTIARLDATGFKIDHEATTFGSSELITPVGADTIWVGTRARGFFRVRAAAGPDGWRTPTTEHFGEKEGLPPTRGYTAAFIAPWGPAFYTAEGTWQFDDASRRFSPEPAFQFSDGPHYAYPNTLDDAGRLWASGGRLDNRDGRPLGWYEIAPGSPRRAATWHPAPAALQSLAGAVGFLNFYHDPVGDIIWGKSPQAVIRFEASRLATLPNAPWQPRLHAISAAGHPQPLASAVAPRYPASPERTTFSFSPGRFGAGTVTYRTRLLGSDDRWSPPATYPEISFTNLEGGPFTLEVIATDAAGRDSSPLRFAFSVAPPWQRTPLAYVLYALALVAAIFAYIRWRLSRGERERARLESLVTTRTAQLATARDQAEAASRAKSAFLASMSHELRTPLNGVLGYAQLLRADKRLAPDQQERLRVVHQSGEHLLHMINDVLDLAKIEAGKLTLRPAPFALGDLLRDITAAHAPAAATKGLVFTLDAAPALPAWVEADAQKLRQVLDNLVGNAIKFTATGSVTLRVTPASPSENSVSQLSALNSQPIAFAIIDTGPGISAADQARLFQAFEQADHHHTTSTTGTGLGLAISRALVERFGGALTLDSTPGRGSTFTFSIVLPVAEAGVTASTSGHRIVGYAGRPLRALLIDDHLVNRRLLAELLTPIGFDCADYAAPAEALTRLTNGAEPWPDLAILDLRMPDMDGLELTRRLRLLPRGAELKILLTSASVIAFDPAEAIRAGCDDFLSKPFRTADLLEKLGRLLGLTWRESDSAAPFPAKPSTVTPLPALTRSALREILATGDLAAFTAELERFRATSPESIAALDELAAAATSFQLAHLRQLLE